MRIRSRGYDRRTAVGESDGEHFAADDRSNWPYRVSRVREERTVNYSVFDYC